MNQGFLCAHEKQYNLATTNRSADNNSVSEYVTTLLLFHYVHTVTPILSVLLTCNNHFHSQHPKSLLQNALITNN